MTLVRINKTKVSERNGHHFWLYIEAAVGFLKSTLEHYLVSAAGFKHRDRHEQHGVAVVRMIVGVLVMQPHMHLVGGPQSVASQSPSIISDSWFVLLPQH